ncbi:MAG TPA: SDR family oxidoreductase [Saprospiraceae bacterium]|nr:SDR family oxidoreductase [Saprospiraceae bacterium]
MIEINLKGLNALVCGASKGIGRATAMALAESGANVTCLSRNELQLKEMVAQLNKSYSDQEHHYLVADQSKPEELKIKLTEWTRSRSIHILINNSGGPAAGPIESAQLDDFRHAFEQHLISNHILVNSCLASMKQANYGRIINIISTSVKQPLQNLGVSNTIRAAVANWAKSLSNELAAFGITVNNILPGATMTERLEGIIEVEAQKQNLTTDQIRQKMLLDIPMKRFGHAEEIAQAALFLASPMASYITGINLPVDGGRTKSL